MKISRADCEVAILKGGMKMPYIGLLIVSEKRRCKTCTIGTEKITASFLFTAEDRDKMISALKKGNFDDGIPFTRVRESGCKNLNETMRRASA